MVKLTHDQQNVVIILFARPSSSSASYLTKKKLKTNLTADLKMVESMAQPTHQKYARGIITKAIIAIEMKAKYHNWANACVAGQLGSC